MLKYIFAFFRALKLCFPATPGVRYYRHRENKFLYYLISDTHIKEDEEEKMFKTFPKAIRCSMFRFNFLIAYHDTPIVEVIDDYLHDENKISEAEVIRENEERNERIQKAFENINPELRDELKKLHK